MNPLGRSFRYLASLMLPAMMLTVAPSAVQATMTTKQEPQQTARKTGRAITDAWITMKVHSQFIPEDALSDSDIDVDTKNGAVTLTGTVRTEAGRARAVAVAKATDGVKSVNDQLRIGSDSADAAREAGRDAGAAAREAGREVKGVAGTAGRAVTDGWIKSKIYAQFVTENALEDSEIDVDVAKGMVTLNGTVPTAAGRTRAVAIAKATDGVKNVKDNLKVGSR
jgi:hyperosmotically inducible protein